MRNIYVRISYFIHDWYSLFSVRNFNAMPEVREKVFDPDLNKAFTQAKLAN